jgi:hypothetical protein
MKPVDFWMGEEEETFKYIWYKINLQGTIKKIAILEISNNFINSLISVHGGNSPIVWVFIAFALHSRYPGIFPPIWDDWGNLNAFWGSNDLMECDEYDGCGPYLEYPVPTFRI